MIEKIYDICVLNDEEGNWFRLGNIFYYFLMLISIGMLIESVFFKKLYIDDWGFYNIYLIKTLIFILSLGALSNSKLFKLSFKINNAQLFYETRKEAERNRKKGERIYFVGGTGYYIVRTKKLNFFEKYVLRLP